MDFEILCKKGTVGHCRLSFFTRVIERPLDAITQNAQRSLQTYREQESNV